ncbi:MAG: lipocalin family protein [Alistipes senegalensis]|nr:lipocalin family protein [Bacteroides cellulosilyticus]MCM1351380.1 lipocalin family protein [Alistipes senegalensis]
MKRLFFAALLALCIGSVGCTDRSDLLVGDWQLYYVYGADSNRAEFAYEIDWDKSIYRLRPDGTGVHTDGGDDADGDRFDWTLSGRKLGIRYPDTGCEYYSIEMLTADELVLKYAFRSCDVVRYQCYRRVRARSNSTSRNR